MEQQNNNCPIKPLTVEMFFKESMIFQNFKVFNTGYIPNHFLYREKELQQLINCFSSLNNGSSINVWLNGPPSTGKTHILKYMTKTFNDHVNTKGINLRYIYVSARDSTVCQLYGNILQQLNNEAETEGLSTGQRLIKILKHANNYNGINFIIDEIDKLKTTSNYQHPIDTVIGNFTRLTEMCPNFNSEHMLTVASNDVMLHKKLEPSTSSSFSPENIHFQEYNAPQIGDILWKRCQNGFKKNVIKHEDVDYLGAILCQSIKDIRTGLHVLMKAGKLAEENNKPNIPKEYLTQAEKIVEKNKLQETIIRLDDSQVSLLLGIAKVQRRFNDSVDSNDVYHEYRKIAQKNDSDPLKNRYLMEFVSPKIESMGLITTSFKGRGRGRGRTNKKFEICGEDLNEIINVCECTLSSRL